MGEIIKPEKAENIKESRRILKSPSYRVDGRVRDGKGSYVPLAERIRQQEQTLPDRFRYRVSEKKSGRSAPLRNTVPQGPRLATYERKGKTRREMEGERIRTERIAKEQQHIAKDSKLRTFLKQNRVTI